MSRTFQLAWTTDDWPSRGTFGPNGPWPALSATIGKPLSSPISSNVALWPCFSCRTSSIFTGAARNSTLSEARLQRNVTSDELRGLAANVNDGDPLLFNYTAPGSTGFNNVAFVHKESDLSSVSFNLSLFATDTWSTEVPSRMQYSPEVGLLSLAPRNLGSTWESSLIDALLGSNLIDSASYGLHLGSVLTNQSASLVFGGFETNRAYGPVATFGFSFREADFAYAAGATGFLSDVFLGVESGVSPFNRSNTSLWTDLSTNSKATAVTKSNGGPQGSAAIIFDPVVPYLYLPSKICEAVASSLPVTWSSESAIYLWDEKDPQYPLIMNTSSYLGMVFNDGTKNVTIKVPFQLLNLTLEPPLATSSKPYFPCAPFNTTSGYFHLGRAFLQAAFFGVNQDQNVTFLAQAPGPDMEPSSRQEISSQSREITTGDLSKWAGTWSSVWQPAANSSNSTSNASPGPVTGSSTQGTGGSGLSTGAVAGIAIGCLAGLVVMILAIAIILRRKWGPRRRHDPALLENTVPTRNLGGELAAATVPQEAHSAEVYEKSPTPVPRAMNTTTRLCEAPTTEWPPEMPSEMPSNSKNEY